MALLVLPIGPSILATTVILFSRNTMRAKNGYVFSLSACDTVNKRQNTHLV